MPMLILKREKTLMIPHSTTGIMMKFLTMMTVIQTKDL